MITGTTTLMVGETLNLTCEAQTDPQGAASVLTWRQAGSDITLGNGTLRAFLVIPNVTSQESGRYECRDKQHALSSLADVTVITKRKY